MNAQTSGPAVEVEWQCAWCDAPIRVSPVLLGATIYCSHTCAVAWRDTRRKGRP